MSAFDYLIFADWPRGLYLAQKLADNNKKIAYVECLPRLKNPFALFLNENNTNLRHFFESLGFLSQQEGGFCLLSPENVWPLQEMGSIAERHAAIKNFTCSHREGISPSFRDNWLSYLSLNLSAKVFKDNNSIFNKRGVNLLDDYFLFEPSPKKAEEFKNKRSNISFFMAQEKSISFKKQQAILILKDSSLTAKNFICLSDLDRISTDFKLTDKAYLQWQAYYLKADFFEYKEIIPAHFLFLESIYLPWCYDNLLSVFHHQGMLEVWMRLKPEETSTQFIEQAENRLKNFFKGCLLKFLHKPIAKGFKVYGEKRLDFYFPKTNIYIENSLDFFHGDLASEIYNEQNLFKKLSGS